MRRCFLAFCLTLVVLAGAAPAARAGSAPSLVALGDSFSSGEGAPPFDPDAGECHRSTLAWPVVLAGGSGWAARVLACSGAVIDDIAARQVASLERLDGATVVTVTAGGNDAGFADVLKLCALRWRCDRSYTSGGHDRLRERVLRLAGRLAALYRRVQRASPTARLAVVGYPRLFPRHPGLLTCAALGLISAPEIRYLNARTADLDAVIARAAAAAGARYVDVLEALAAHPVLCHGVQWVNHLRFGSGLVWSFHPNAAGQRRLAEVIGRALRAGEGE